jgi:hypothetical protein
MLQIASTMVSIIICLYLFEEAGGCPVIITL